MAGLQRRTAILKTLYPGASCGYPGQGPKFPFDMGITNSPAWTANRSLLVRFVPEEDMLVTKISFHLSTLDAGDPGVAVAIYGPDSASPLPLLATSGSLTGVATSTGIKTLALTVPPLLIAGSVYYLALSSASAVMVVQSFSANGAINLTFFGATAPNLMAGVVGANHPPVTGVTLATGANNEVPLLIARTD